MKILNPNCSEAVFRFYTLEPKKIQKILQAIADEISANCEFHKNQKIPLFKTAEEYKKPLLFGCAGLGDDIAIITIEKDKGAFRLNIGNNDIAQNTTGWVEKIKAMGIKVEEAETCKELEKYARDCTCGYIWFD